MKYKVEHDTYGDIGKRFRGRGYMVQRIEANTSVPDFHISKKALFYWVEVKMYLGKKPIRDITADDLVWKPGQLRFRNDMINTGSKDHYLLVVCDGEKFHMIVGGLDRC